MCGGCRRSVRPAGGPARERASGARPRGTSARPRAGRPEAPGSRQNERAARSSVDHDLAAADLDPILVVEDLDVTHAVTVDVSAEDRVIEEDDQPTLDAQLGVPPEFLQVIDQVLLTPHLDVHARATDDV